MEECRACLLTPAQEAHHLDIHQRHLVQVQHGPGSVALQLGLQGLQCTACRWPISRSVVWCPSVCRSILQVICVVSFLASALSVTVDERSYCKNETIHNLLMYLRFDGGGSADTSAIAEGSAPMISTTVRGAGSDRSCMDNTRRCIQQVCANT